MLHINYLLQVRSFKYRITIICYHFVFVKFSNLPIKSLIIELENAEFYDSSTDLTIAETMQKKFSSLFQGRKIWNSIPSSILGHTLYTLFGCTRGTHHPQFLIMIVINFACSITTASKTPGWVTIFLKGTDGKKLGGTKIWYYDEDKESVKRMIENPKLQTDFFRNYSEMLSNRNTTTTSGADAQNSGICGEWCMIECF